MLISLNWIRDFVDLPADIDGNELAERFTLYCAEVEGVSRVSVDAQGLIAAAVVEVQPLSGMKQNVLVDIGGRTVSTVSIAENLTPGSVVVYAPPGASVKEVPDIGTTQVDGVESVGMILPCEALGMTHATQEAVFLPPDTKPGAPIDGALFEDFLVEVDNKSITHRPDLWGHYGIARELAAIYGLPLKPYPVVDAAELEDESLPEIPIVIDDPQRAPRYSGLRFSGVRTRPAPLQMQVRLSRVGIRPIDLLVDLTNYIMAELGQPMHAFDGDDVDSIEVANAADGEKFFTLDGLQRTLNDTILMIQCRGKSIALAGVMGGFDTEIKPRTKSMLLESANFEPAVIRRGATALGLRTEASARFEKSLDPANTVLAIRRFIYLAKPEYPELTLTSRLSDCYPAPAKTVKIDVDLNFLRRFIGRDVSDDEVVGILNRLEFGTELKGAVLTVTVPGFRATKDVTIEADVIEEVARFVGYGNIEARLPEITARCFEPNAQHELERRTLDIVANGLGFLEIYDYIWYDSTWCKQLGFDPGDCIKLRNPAASGLEQLRQTLVPSMLAAAERNRHHQDRFRLLQIGGTFHKSGDESREERRIGLLSVVRGKKSDDVVLADLKHALEAWSRQVLGRSVRFSQPSSDRFEVWESPQKTADVVLDDRPLGRVTTLPLLLKRRIDEHLAAWSVAVAEVKLPPDAISTEVRKLHDIPAYPQIDLDFSVLVDKSRRYADVVRQLGEFQHDLLERLTFVDSYEGKSIPHDKRSLTFRARIGHPDRTLVEEDIRAFRSAFEGFLGDLDLELRS